MVDSDSRFNFTTKCMSAKELRVACIIQIEEKQDSFKEDFRKIATL